LEHSAVKTLFYKNVETVFSSSYNNTPWMVAQETFFGFAFVVIKISIVAVKMYYLQQVQ